LTKNLDTAAEGTPLDLRDQALAELVAAEGMSAADVVGLDVDDRPVLELAARPAMKAWLERGRPALAARQDNGRLEPALFVSKTGRRLSPSDVRRRLQVATRQLGTGEGTSGQALRQTLAGRLVEGGTDPRLVPELNAGANTSTIRLYSRVESKRLRKAYARAHPRA
jgi:integrase/recombinase XerC/integrase/recombinase XerD